MKKRWICSALTLTLVAGLLTGCGSSSGSAAGTAGEPEYFYLDGICAGFRN